MYIFSESFVVENLYGEKNLPSTFSNLIWLWGLPKRVVVMLILKSTYTLESTPLPSSRSLRPPFDLRYFRADLGVYFFLAISNCSRKRYNQLWRLKIEFCHKFEVPNRFKQVNRKSEVTSWRNPFFSLQIDDREFQKNPESSIFAMNYSKRLLYLCSWLIDCHLDYLEPSAISNRPRKCFNHLR